MAAVHKTTSDGTFDYTKYFSKQDCIIFCLVHINRWWAGKMFPGLYSFKQLNASQEENKSLHTQTSRRQALNSLPRHLGLSVQSTFYRNLFNLGVSPTFSLEWHSPGTNLPVDLYSCYGISYPLQYSRPRGWCDPVTYWKPTSLPRCFPDHCCQFVMTPILLCSNAVFFFLNEW